YCFGCAIPCVQSQTLLVSKCGEVNCSVSEDLAFDNAGDFQTQVINFLRIGLERAGGGRYPSLRGVQRQFQTDVQAYIMTPQKEASAPVAEGQQPTDDTVTYVEGLQYKDMV